MVGNWPGNGFSWKAGNLAAAVAGNFMYYNFARPHKALGGKTTPAMAAGITDHVWTCEEIAELQADQERYCE